MSDYVDIKTACDQTGIPESTFRRRLSDGSLPYFQAKRGSKILINLPKVFEILETESIKAQEEAKAEAAERKAKQKARIDDRQALAFADEIEKQEREKVMGECRKAGKPFAIAWQNHLAANRETWECRGRCLVQLINENRAKGGSPETRLTLADGKVPADLVSDYRAKLRAELAALNPESVEKQPQVQSAESDRLKTIGADTTKKSKQTAKKLVDRKFESLLEASSAIAAFEGKATSFTSLSKAQEHFDKLVASQN